MSNETPIDVDFTHSPYAHDTHWGQTQEIAHLFSLIAHTFQQALSKTGIVLGGSGLRVLPSKTAIMPVSREMMPRTTEDIERCSRTVYAANIDKKVDNNDVRNFFETLCGELHRELAVIWAVLQSCHPTCMSRQHTHTMSQI